VLVCLFIVGFYASIGKGRGAIIFMFYELGYADGIGHADGNAIG